MEPTLSLPLAAATVNLRRILAIRALVLALQVGAAVLAHVLAELPLPYPTLTAIFVLIGALTGLSWWRTHRDWPVTDAEYAAHLMVDILGLSAVLYFAGGASNPFISYYLVPLSIAAATLPWRYSWLIAGLCLLAYSLLLFHYQPLETLAPHHGHTGQGLNLHVVGMWGNFLVSAVLITYFVVKMAAAVREREAALTEHREAQLQDEQLLALATMAAGTAHELGTPLNTMTVLVDELRAEHAGQAALQTDLTTLSGQLALCRTRLNSLVSTARHYSEHSAAPVTLADFAAQLREQWQLMRPSTALRLELAADNALALAADKRLEQSLFNLLNNAADVSPGEVELRIAVASDELLFAISDRGPGIPLEQADELGRPFVTTKGRGLGLGLFLSHSTARRYGGSLTWFEREGGGSRVELRLPLARVAATIDP